MKHCRLIFLIALSAVFSVCLVAAEQPQMPPAQVKVVLATERAIAPTSQFSGSVISLNNSKISSQVDGELIWLARVGAEVKKNEVIANIDPELLQVNATIAAAKVKKTEADLAFQQTEVARIKKLAKHDNTSKAKYQQEAAKLAMLNQDLVSAKAEQRRARHNLSNANIKAPFAGHVMRRLASVGEYISQSKEILQLVDTSNKEISVNAPIRLLALIDKSSQIEVSNKLETKQLPITTIVPVADKISRMAEIRLAADQVDWPVGSPVSVMLPKSKGKMRVSVPRDALVIKGSDVYVYRINDSMQAEQIKATVDAIDGMWVALKSTLSAGDKIVIRGGERLMPNQSVTILKE